MVSKNKSSPIKPLKIAHNIIALFILCGKNHVWILFEASEKNSLESSDIGMKEKQAIKPLKKNRLQKYTLKLQLVGELHLVLFE